jgi:hypothetical protein
MIKKLLHKWFPKETAEARVTWQYTMLPMTPDEEDAPVKPWEYIDIMNSMGAANWELVGISFNTLIFKRPNVKVR